MTDSRAAVGSRLLPALVLIFAVGCARPPDRPPVGRTTRAFEDPKRPSFAGPGPRPVTTTVWYPTADPGPERPWRIGVFRFGWAVPDGRLKVSASPRPLVLLSHGTGGAAAQMSWLAERLASRGMIVAAVSHHGNTAAEPAYLPHGFALWWERALDLQVVKERLLADPTFGPAIDEDRIAAAGFSLGGYTVLALAGAEVSLPKHTEFCATAPQDPACRLPPEAPFDLGTVERLADEDEKFKASRSRAGRSYRDPSVKAVVAMAPVLGPALTEASLAKADVPTLIVVGDRDDQATLDLNARWMADVMPNAQLEVLPDVSHYTFLAPCTLKGRIFVRALCSDASGVQRESVHRQVGEQIARFLDRHLPAAGRTGDQ